MRRTPELIAGALVATLSAALFVALYIDLHGILLLLGILLGILLAVMVVLWPGVIEKYIRACGYVYNYFTHYLPRRITHYFKHFTHYFKRITHITRPLVNYYNLWKRTNLVRVLPGELYLNKKKLKLNDQSAPQYISESQVIKREYSNYLKYCCIHSMRDIKRKLKPSGFYPNIKVWRMEDRNIYTNANFRYCETILHSDGDRCVRTIFYEGFHTQTNRDITVIIHDEHVLIFYKKLLLYYFEYDYERNYSYKFKFKNIHVECSTCKITARDLSHYLTNELISDYTPQPIGRFINLTINNAQVKFYEETKAGAALVLCPICYCDTILRVINPCAHKICLACVMNIHTCPYCRADITSVK